MNRLGAACAIGGTLLLIVGTALHPLSADPNDPVAAFTEYAADRAWVASHLTQLAGVALIVAALLRLGQRLADDCDSLWPRLGMAAAIVSLALAAGLQAVDGVALKTMVDAWARAPSAEKVSAFHAALAVRQIEVGLASMLSLAFGTTAMLFAIALLGDRRYPRWFAVLAIVGGAPTIVAGLVMAHTGFSPLAMAIGMPANLALLAWTLAIGILSWRPVLPRSGT